MGITYGDHRIDSGDREITPEQERERDEATVRELITDEMVDCALNAWFASPPSETDQGLERSMRAALEAAMLRQVEQQIEHEQYEREQRALAASNGQDFS